MRVILLFSFLLTLKISHATPLLDARLYTIQKGDQLMLISKKLYGTVHRYREILDLNPALDPWLLQIGSEIVVPLPEEDSRIVHLVRPGDQMMKISYLYFGTHKLWKKIVKVNPGINPFKLIIGAKILIPKKPKRGNFAIEELYFEKILAQAGLLLISEYHKFVFAKTSFGTGVHQFF